MNNKIKGILFLLLSLFFAFYAICQILAVSTSSVIKLKEPIQLEKGREYQFNYKHNIWDVFNSYAVSLLFDKKPNIVPIERYDKRHIEYKINVILKNKDKTLYDSISGNHNIITTGFGRKDVEYDIYQYNYNIYEPREYTLILKVLETDPILAELNPRVKVTTYSRHGTETEAVAWFLSLSVAFIFFILTFGKAAQYLKFNKALQLFWKRGDGPFGATP